jgi:hypothetical protein
VRFRQDFRNSATRVSKTFCDYRLIATTVEIAGSMSVSISATIRIMDLSQSRPNWRMSRLREISARANAPWCSTFSTITT